MLKKCIEHINHCQRCLVGLDIYEERGPNSYENGRKRQFQAEAEYEKNSCSKQQENENGTTFATTDVEIKIPKEKPELDLHSLCEKCRVISPESQEEVKKDNENCVWKPIKTIEFKLLKDEMYCRKSQCEIHQEHCSVCGKGIYKESEGSQYMTCYDYLESQNIYYPEVDHYKCNECDAAAIGILPSNETDWSRKQSYLDFLLQQRKNTDTNDCFLKRSKKRSNLFVTPGFQSGDRDFKCMTGVPDISGPIYPDTFGSILEK
jgi:hypothetical protein